MGHLPRLSCLVIRAWRGNKKERETCALCPQISGIAKRHNKMNGKETIFPRRDIYTLATRGNTRNRHIHRMSISCLRSSNLNLAILRSGLVQNAFLHQWIYYMKPLLLGKASKPSLLSLTRGFLPTDTA